MKFKLNKRFVACLAISLLGLFMIYLEYRDYQVFLELQDKGRYLSRIESSPVPHLAEGRIELIKSETSSRLPMGKYTYSYSFPHNGQTYSNLITVYKSIWTLRYLPAPGYRQGPVLPETIIFDPDNPDINLPLQYARVLPTERNPFIHLFAFFGVLAFAGLVGWIVGNDTQK